MRFYSGGWCARWVKQQIVEVGRVEIRLVFFAPSERKNECEARSVQSLVIDDRNLLREYAGVRIAPSVTRTALTL